MARIEGVADEKASLISRGLFRLARRKLGRVSEMVRIAAHVPRILLGRGLFELLLDSSALVERRLRWLGVIKTAMLVGCPAWLDADAALGRAAGITDDQLAELARYRESGAFSPVEKLVLDLAVGMAATPAVVSDELFAELQRHFTSAQLVELVTDIAMGNMRSRFNRAFLCQPAGFSEGAYCPLPEKWNPVCPLRRALRCRTSARRATQSQADFALWSTVEGGGVAPSRDKAPPGP